VEKIISFARLTKNDAVLEIGPGKGILTRSLADHAHYVIAIEKDDLLYEALVEEFNDNSRVTLIHEDALECDLTQYAKKGAKVVANLPYNIASQVIMRFADSAPHFSDIVVMVQKEVGERICAKLGSHDYSAFTVIIGSVFDPVSGFIVGPGNFFPRPKIDSMVIKLKPKATPVVPKEERDALKKVVFSAFGQRRKILKNSLSGLGLDQSILQKIAKNAEINLGLRPQNLSVQDFYRLSKAYQLV
jgi:16S rRNA (adenine1518-N6/adenine1519-N6)-dimethyltransferase